MTHAWVRAFIPYIPNRGAKTGTADTWVRIDPSFKHYDYQPGVAINGKVRWSEDDFLQNSAVRPRTDYYGDRIWSFIRSNNIDCQNLTQVPKTGHVHTANLPFVPSTLTVRIDQTLGLAVDPPSDQLQHVTLTLGNGTNAIATYDSTLAALWGKKLTLTFAPATADDAAIIATNGGLFSTPAYLV